MDDLISREEAYNVLTEYYHHKTDIQHQELREAPSKVPSAERYAKWEYVDYGGMGNYHCTTCLAIGNKNYNYCPNCGARMDGKQDG